MTLPVDIRRSLDLKEGDKVRFVPDGSGWRIVPANLPIEVLKGALPKPNTPVSLAEMDAAIAEGASGG